MNSKIFTSLICLSFIIPEYCLAFGDDSLVQTQGYWSPIYPGSPYWPDAKTSLPGYGTESQQQNIATNPDLFCASQGQGWRLPSLADITYNGYMVAPGFATDREGGSKFGALFGGFQTRYQTPNIYSHELNSQFHASDYTYPIRSGNNPTGIGLGNWDNLHPSNFWDGKNRTKPKLDVSQLKFNTPFVPSSLSIMGTLSELFMGMQIEGSAANGLDLGYGSNIDSTKELFYTNTYSNNLAPFGFPPALFKSVYMGQSTRKQYWLAEVTSPEMLPPNTPPELSAQPNRAIVYAEVYDPAYRTIYYTGSVPPTETANIMCVRQYY